jgi:hypothetical protein
MTATALAFDRVDEAAAYVAALSRFINYPQGEAYRHAGLKIWSGAKSDGAIGLFLSPLAVAATRAAFGTLPVSARSDVEPGPQSTLVLDGAEVTPMGIDEALARLVVPSAKAPEES